MEFRALPQRRRIHVKLKLWERSQSRSYATGKCVNDFLEIIVTMQAASASPERLG